MTHKKILDKGAFKNYGRGAIKMSTLLNKFYLVKLSIIGEGRRDINKVQNFVHVGFEGVSKRLSVRIASVFF